jgi:hypothetical protein
MLQNPERHYVYTARSTTILPTWGQWKVAAGVNWHMRSYPSRKSLEAAVTAYNATRCLGLSIGFWVFPGWHPDKVLLQNALRPAPAIQSVIDGFIGEAVGSSPFIGIHMRLTDLGYANETFCLRNMTITFNAVRRAMRVKRITSVLLATDDFDSHCAKHFIDTFTQTKKVMSNVYDPNSCSEAQFVQEVIAKGACFIGTVNSTFTVAIEQIRMSSRALGTDKPGCSITLGAGQARFEW